MNGQVNNGSFTAAGGPALGPAGQANPHPHPPLHRPRPRPPAKAGSGLFTGKKKAIDMMAMTPAPAPAPAIAVGGVVGMDVDMPIAQGQGQGQGRQASPALGVGSGVGGMSRGTTPIPAGGMGVGMGSAIPGRLLPGAGVGGRASPGPGQGQGQAPAMSRSASASGMSGIGSPRLRPQQDSEGRGGEAGYKIQEYPIMILPNEESQNPAYVTDPVLRSLPFPTAFNILQLHHPSSSALPLPDLSNEHTLLYLNHKDLSAAPPPDPEIARQKALDAELKAEIRKPVKQPNGEWKARTWDPKSKGALKDPEGKDIWKLVADPALIAPLPTHLISAFELAQSARKKGKRGGRGGGRGGRGGGGAGGDDSRGYGQVKYRPEPVMLRGRGKQKQFDLPSSSEEEVDVDANGQIIRQGTPNKEQIKTKKVWMTKSSRKRIAYNNGLNREKLPMVLEGEFKADKDVVAKPPPAAASNTTTTTTRAGSTPNSPNPYAQANANIKPQIAANGSASMTEAESANTMSARTTFVPINFDLRPPARYHGHQLTAADGGSGSGGYTTVALCFQGMNVGLRFVGREYKMNILRERMPVSRMDFGCCCLGACC